MNNISGSQPSPITSSSEVGNGAGTRTPSPSEPLTPSLPASSITPPGDDQAKAVKLQQLQKQTKGTEGPDNDPTWIKVAMTVLNVLDFLCGAAIVGGSVFMAVASFGSLVPLGVAVGVSGSGTGLKMLLDPLKELIKTWQGEAEQSDAIQLTEEHSPEVQLTDDSSRTSASTVEITPHKKHSKSSAIANSTQSEEPASSTNSTSPGTFAVFDDPNAPD